MLRVRGRRAVSSNARPRGLATRLDSPGIFNSNLNSKLNYAKNLYIPVKVLQAHLTLL